VTVCPNCYQCPAAPEVCLGGGPTAFDFRFTSTANLTLHQMVATIASAGMPSRERVLRISS